MHRVIFLSLAFLCLDSAALANGNFADYAECNLKKGDEIVATTGRIRLGIDGEKFSTTLYDQNYEVYAYIDVKPLGSEAAYNSELSVSVGEMPEDSGAGLGRIQTIIDLSQPREDETPLSVMSVEIAGDYSVSCVQMTDFYLN